MKVNVSDFYTVHYLSKINNQNLLLIFVNPKLSKHDTTETFIVFLEKERSASLEKEVCFYLWSGDALKEQTHCSLSAATIHPSVFKETDEVVWFHGILQSINHLRRQAAGMKSHALLYLNSSQAFQEVE